MSNASAIAHSGHFENSGIQNHSAGEVFPVILVAVINHESGSGYHYARHPDGRKGPHRYYFRPGRDGYLSFIEAHDRAVGDAYDLLRD
jgi:hypothetical protein